MLAYLYPGQGAQSAGFLHRLPPNAAVRDTLDEASQVLGLDVLTLDSADALRSTVAVQLSLVIAGVAMTRQLAAEGLGPEMCAGLSIGAYAAAVGCEALAFADALHMAKKRAELMESAYPGGYGLSAISGLTEHEIEALARGTENDAAGRIYIANVNAPRQIVVAGSDAALAAFNERALAAGARKATRLDVSVPSHCELLAHASDELLAYSANVPFRAPRSTYIGNRSARPLHSADAVRDDLATNMRHTVRWFDALSVMIEMGATLLVQAPPGQVLTDIAADAYPDVRAISASTIAHDKLAETIRRRLG
ncbi:malonate decarboxylase subunit epsilon [Trinickia terrae]|uniref:Malonyl CoA-acyl carrier protein transacylase n=1 Tax=Trinickia terrae TaxID=2571161 RepID=A0A4U1IFQ9_9BURK|nr:malonate decarboxylase subunit epsilon [Trinickia terrae]TKC92527.1 malonate decarboxylase subunit epsilon [Trinickia terrae]